MTTKSPEISSSTDLVLQLAGGNRNGQLLPVSTAKCLLSSLIADKAEAEKYRCAIFRGEKGVAFRSYSELVLVNGNKTSVQWLKEGDTIQLTPEMKVIVKHLGTFSPTTPQAPVAAPREGASTLTTGSDANARSTNASQQTNVPAPATTESSTAPSGDVHVGQRINTLSDQLTSLVDAASQTGTVSAVAAPTNEPAPETPAVQPLSDKKMADASSSIQDYLNKALASPSANAITPSEPTSQTSITAPTSPAGSATTTTEAQTVEATSALPAISDAAQDSQNSAKSRQEEVSSTLNRLLGETPESPAASPQADPSSAVQVAAAGQVATEPAANASKAQSIEFLKSLGIDADELGLDSRTPAPENKNSELPQPVASRENVSSAVLPTADEIIASASMGSAVLTDADSAATADLPSAAEPPAATAPRKAESVADVLSRMQNAGSLDSFSVDGPEAEATVEPTNVAPATEVAPPKPQVTESVVAETTSESDSARDEDSSVEDYMSQLLNRMRGSEDSTVSEDKGSVDETPVVSQEAPVEPQVVQPPEKVESPQERLTAEQFLPKEKAVRMKSFDSLREIANNSNRLAIQDHLANQRKVSTQTKMQLAFISLGFGVLFFLMSWVFSSEVSVGGVFCGIAFLFCGVVFAKFYRDEQKLDESIIKAQKDKA